MILRSLLIAAAPCVSRLVCMASANEIRGFGRHVLVHHIVWCGVYCHV